MDSSIDSFLLALQASRHFLAKESFSFMIVWHLTDHEEHFLTASMEETEFFQKLTSLICKFYLDNGDQIGFFMALIKYNLSHFVPETPNSSNKFASNISLLSTVIHLAMPQAEEIPQSEHNYYNIGYHLRAAIMNQSAAGANRKALCSHLLLFLEEPLASK